MHEVDILDLDPVDAVLVVKEQSEGWRVYWIGWDLLKIPGVSGCVQHSKGYMAEVTSLALKTEDQARHWAYGYLRGLRQAFRAAGLKVEGFS